MSYWTYVHGTVVVSPMGRTQAEKRYILETVLDHLPVVTGSERDMNIYVIQKAGHNMSCGSDEFGEVTNNLRDRFGDRSRRRGWLYIRDEYILVVDGSLRDREFDQTFREFQKWLCRLAKRVSVEKVQVEIDSYTKTVMVQGDFRDRNDIYGDMYEWPTWCHGKKEKMLGTYGEPNWCEYLMWQRVKNSSYPMLLGYKYYSNEENDAEVERRIKWEKGD